MNLDDVYLVVRSINFFWCLILFFFMVWYGILDLLLSHRCAHEDVPPEMRLLHCAGLGGVVMIMASLAEIFLTDATGGVRVFFTWFFLVPVTWGLKYGIFRVVMHKKAVANGDCASR